MSRGPVLILMYHRVDDGRDRAGLRVRPEAFAQQVDVLQRRGEIVPLADVLEPARHPRFVVTFDDGFADNLHVAQPILERADAPATYFVTTGMLDCPDGFWQDRLASLLLDRVPAASGIEVTIAGRPLWVDVGSSEARERAFEALSFRLRRRPPAEITTVFDSVVSQVGAPPDLQAVPRTLTADELRALSIRPGVEIGAHTTGHAWLSGLAADEQRSEIFDSRRTLERLVDRPVTSFAYPFGTEEAFDGTSVEVVRESGFDLAVQAYGGRVPRRPDRYRLPRVFISDRGRDTFAASIDEFLAA
jgi:peptidoglycan/xylan/chitin deacetylase (PgdA/CDA1 family)